MLTVAFARELFPEQQFRITRTKQFKLLTRAPRAAPAGPRSLDARAPLALDDSAVTVDDFSRARNLISLLDGGVRESIAKRYARSLTLSINDDADRAVELYTFSFSYPSSASITRRGRLSLKGSGLAEARPTGPLGRKRSTSFSA